MALAILQGREAQMTVGDSWREIVDPNFYVKAGWPNYWVDQFHKTHQAASGAVMGVWHLDFLRGLSKVLGIKAADEFGPYTEARQIAIQVWNLIYEMKEKENAPKEKASGQDDGL